MSTINFFNIKQELVVFLRNADVMTTTLRGVTTTSDTGSWSGATSHLINRSNVRNIRSITVDSSLLVFGTDYTVDYFYNDAGTRKCKITLNASQTGDYSISYDYGYDKIYPDDPQETLTIDDFPQMRVDISGTNTRQAGIGNELRTSIMVEVTIYGPSKTDIQNYMTSIRSAMVSAAETFYYAEPYIKPSLTTGIIKNDKFSDKIFQQTAEFEMPYTTELN